MLTRQETVTITGVGAGAIANFWIDWAQPVIEGTVLIASLIGICLLVYQRLVEIKLKRIELKKAEDEE